MEDYISDKIRRDIIKEISNLELPNNWDPQKVVEYIIRKINRE